MVTSKTIITAVLLDRFIEPGQQAPLSVRTETHPVTASWAIGCRVKQLAAGHHELYGSAQHRRGACNKHALLLDAVLLAEAPACIRAYATQPSGLHAQHAGKAAGKS